MHTIAIVEDNEDNQLVLQAILEDLYDITIYGDGPQALTGLTETVPDMVLLDISLPGMDGPEVLVRLRQNEQLKHLPVVALTAHAMTGDREKFLALGFDDYVTKPIVDENILLSVLTKWLNSSTP